MNYNNLVWKARPHLLSFVSPLLQAIAYALVYYFLGRGYMPSDYVFALDILAIVFFLFTLFYGLFITLTTSYSLLSGRLIITQGFLNQRKNEIELYRIKDYEVIKPLFLRVFGLAHIRLLSSDYSNPEVVLRGLNKAELKKDQIRSLVEQLRTSKGVREFD